LESDKTRDSEYWNIRAQDTKNEIQTLHSELPAPQEGCVPYKKSFGDEDEYDYMNIPFDLRLRQFWITQGPVNLLPWFLVTHERWSDMYSGSMSDEERLMYKCVILSVAHDEGGKLDSADERIYRHEPYQPQYFKRDEFCGALWEILKDDQTRIERAYDYVKPYLDAWREKQEKAKATPSGVTAGERLAGPNGQQPQGTLQDRAVKVESLVRASDENMATFRERDRKWYERYKKDEQEKKTDTRDSLSPPKSPDWYGNTRLEQVLDTHQIPDEPQASDDLRALARYVRLTILHDKELPYCDRINDGIWSDDETFVQDVRQHWMYSIPETIAEIDSDLDAVRAELRTGEPAATPSVEAASGQTGKTNEAQEISRLAKEIIEEATAWLKKPEGPYPFADRRIMTGSFLVYGTHTDPQSGTEALSRIDRIIESLCAEGKDGLARQIEQKVDSVKRKLVQVDRLGQSVYGRSRRRRHSSVEQAVRELVGTLSHVQEIEEQGKAGQGAPVRPLSKDVLRMVARSTGAAAKEFCVFRGCWNPNRHEEQVFVIEKDLRGEIVASCRVERPIKRAGEYQCSSKDNSMLRLGTDDLLPAIRAPVWSEPLADKELTDAEAKYGPLAGDFRELAELISDADKTFRSCLDPEEPERLPCGPDEVFILSQELRVAGYKSGTEYLPYSPHSWHLKQSVDTYKPVMRILHSAVRLKSRLNVVSGSTDSARQFYGELEETLRFLKKPIKESDYTATSGDYMRVTSVMGWREIKGDYVYVGDSVADGTRQADNLIARLHQWQEKWIASLNTTASMAGQKGILGGVTWAGEETTEIDLTNWNKNKNYDLVLSIIDDKRREGVSVSNRRKLGIIKERLQLCTKNTGDGRYKKFADSLKFKNGRIVTKIPLGKISARQKD
jgi:hypothetical protein